MKEDKQFTKEYVDSVVHTHEYENPELIRRRFYLSKESLAFIDNLALRNNLTASKLLDTVLMHLKNKEGL